jgi:oxygen-independent coproporphyrinogen-3 oxidase
VSDLQQAGAAIDAALQRAVDIQGLYLHIPFCFHKCHYCDFYSVVSPADRAQEQQAAFTTALMRELRRRAGQTACRPRTIFVGGGTPTLLDVTHWRTILEVLRETDMLGRCVEFTVEANPETVSPELAATLAAGGVNRVSLGAQSFDPTHLKTLERWHDPRSVAQAMTIFRGRGRGIANLNLDLIFAIPGQTVPGVKDDLKRAMELEPEHISAYSLTFEPSTALAARQKLGQIAPVDEGLERAMYECVIDTLTGAGYEHYEVSAFARPGRRCQHNLAYWTNANWLACGPAAAGHVDGLRWKNAPRLSDYITASPTPPLSELERLDADARIGEALMLRLRLRDGTPHDWLAAQVPADSPRGRRIAQLKALGLLEDHGNALRLTHAGLCIADSVIAELL